MPYINPDIIIEARQMDLLTYLRNYEPHELVKFSGNTYTTRIHDWTIVNKLDTKRRKELRVK